MTNLTFSPRLISAGLLLAWPALAPLQAGHVATNRDYRLEARVLSGLGGTASTPNRSRGLTVSGAQDAMAHPGGGRAGTNALGHGFLSTVDWQRFVAVSSPYLHDMAATQTNVALDFNLGVVSNTINAANVLLYSASRGYLPPAALAYNPQNRRAVLSPAWPLIAGEQVRILALDSIGDIYANAILRFAAGYTVAAQAQGGSFSGQALPTTNAFTAARSVEALDWNGDGRLDVVMVGSGGPALRIWTNDAAGNLGFFTNTAAIPQGRNFVFGDFNRDGRLDAINPNPTGIDRVFTNNGVALSQVAGSGLTDASSAAAAGDLNLDGRLDALLAGSVGNESGVYLGSGNGTFALAAKLTNATEVSDVKLGDLDGDGDLDAVVCGSEPVTVDEVWRNDGRGHFAPVLQADTLWSSIGESSQCQLGDLNGDRRLDVVMVHRTAGIRIFTNNGQAVFGPVSQTNGNGFSVAADKVLLLDVNGDRAPDLVTTLDSGFAVSVWTNNGMAQFSLLRSVTNSVSSGMVLAAGDLDGNGHVDLVTGSTAVNTDPARVWLNVAPPDAPAALNLSAPSTVSLLAQWPAAARAVNYRVEYSANSSSNFVAAAVTNATSLLIGSLTADVLYYVRVRAENDSGFSAYVTNSLLLPTNVVQFTSQGTPYSWLALHYPSTGDYENAAASDTDLDGFQAWEEYLAGTVPTNGASFLPRVALSNAPPGLVAIKIQPTATDRVYRIYSITNLTLQPQPWTPSSTPLTGTPSGLIFVVTNSVPSRMYRTGVGLP